MLKVNESYLEPCNENLNSIYYRTLNNCRFYESEGNEWSLMNEIGVLRGITYSIECTGIDFDISEALHFIEVQQKFKERDSKKRNK